MATPLALNACEVSTNEGYRAVFSCGTVYHTESFIEQFFHVMLFIILYKVVLTLESVDKTLECDHSNESVCVRTTAPGRGWGRHFHIFAVFLSALTSTQRHYLLEYWRGLLHTLSFGTVYYAECEAFEQHSRDHVVLFVSVLNRVALTSTSTYEPLACSRSDESFRPVYFPKLLFAFFL